jgi:hypothetical protein
MNRAQELLAGAGDSARDDTAFVQQDKLRINTKYLILYATHHVTQFGAEIVLSDTL